ncbi:MAG: ATP-binding protein, partial [Methanospirillum sp.]|nr:ATP-binding protein [Methanospirillum sp.]
GDTMNRGYADNREYLHDEFRKLDLLLALYLGRTWHQRPPEDNPFRGLCITDAEIENLFFGKDSAGDPDPTGLLPAIDAITRMIDERKNSSLETGIPLGLPWLLSLFCLDSLEETALIMCLGAEIDPKYGRVYAYLNNDASQKLPTVGLVMSIARISPDDQPDALLRFSHDSPLIRSGILTSPDTGSLVMRPLRLDERVVRFILGQDSIPEGTRQYMEVYYPDKVHEPAEGSHAISALIREDGTRCIYIEGPCSDSRSNLARRVCSELQLPLIIVDTESLFHSTSPEIIVTKCLLEAALRQAALCFDNTDFLAAPEMQEKRDHLTMAVTERYGPIFFAGSIPSPFKHPPLFTIRIPPPEIHARISLWEGALAGIPLEDTVNLPVLSSRFRLSAGQIREAALAAWSYAVAGNSRKPVITQDDLITACRESSNQNLSDHAKKIHPIYTWDDIILPRDSFDQLKEICSHVDNRQTVYHDWGFAKTLSRGRGLNILFSGPSGSGKTMAAEILAHELRLDLYKIDLSTVVSKYIGETERNLSRIFHEAETSNAILFFDEADALFGKRSDVRDSHDRYANIEINYLLQKMEDYDGITILATNMKHHIDAAFLRRMHFVIEISSPDEHHRKLLWSKIFPRAVPSEELDFGFLARQFAITGGNIRNIAVNAAFLAAGNSGKVTMQHIIHATKREYQKIGRVCTETEFGKYYSLICEGS